MARRRSCPPCLEERAREILLQELGDGPARDLVEDMPVCATAGKRKRSAYQQFMGPCLKDQNLKSFDEAGPAMKRCAARWREHKLKSFTAIS